MTGVPRQLRTVDTEQPERSVVFVDGRNIEDDLRRRIDRQPRVLRNFVFELTGAPPRVSERDQHLCRAPRLRRSLRARLLTSSAKSHPRSPASS